MNSESMSSSQPNPSFSMDDFAKALDNYSFDFEQGQVVSGKVIQHTPEGAFVDIKAKTPAFIPLPEITTNRETNLAEILPLETERNFLIIKGQNAEGEVTLSLRQLEIQKTWENLTAKQEDGETVQIIITGTNKGGVVGEVEGLSGFIPRSHLAQRNDLESLVGQILTANLLEVDSEKKKLILSQRNIVQAAAMNELALGELVEGKVVKIQPYGVFVDLNGVTGLLHIKQISNQHIDSLFNLFQVGESIKVMIAEVDEVKKRISLSTKILEEYPGEIIEDKAKLMNDAENRQEKAKKKLEFDT